MRNNTKHEDKNEETNNELSHRIGGRSIPNYIRFINKNHVQARGLIYNFRKTQELFRQKKNRMNESLTGPPVRKYSKFDSNFQIPRVRLRSIQLFSSQTSSSLGSHFSSPVLILRDQVHKHKHFVFFSLIFFFWTRTTMKA